MPSLTEHSKVCTKCKQTKTLDEFALRPDRPKGRKSWCKECERERSNERYRSNQEFLNIQAAEWRKANPDKVREMGLLAKYNITLVDYNQMLIDQNGRCAICGVSRCATGDNFCVDHCHSSGRIRQLLCRRCNTVLGQVADNRTLLLAAAEYLRRHEESDGVVGPATWTAFVRG